MFHSFWGRFASSEKRFLLFVIGAQLLVVTLPYLWAWLVTPGGFEYSGLLYNPDDQNVHLSWARQTAQGHFFARDLFTTEGLQSGERALFFNALTTCIGVLALLGVPLIVAYHLVRILFCVVLLLAFYNLCDRLSDDRRVRMSATVLVAFSSGAGFLAPLFPHRIWMDRPDGSGFPMMPEAFTFSSSFIFTLNVTAMVLLLLTYLAALTAHESDEPKTRAKATFVGFLAAMLLSNIHTYDAIPLLFTLILWSAVARSTLPALTRWKSTAVIVVGALLPVAYQFLVFRGSEEFRVKALTPTPAPPLLDVLLSYGLLIPLAVAGGVLGWRFISPRQRPVLQLVVLWIFVTLSCIYLPVSFARKMIEGLHLPLCLLAAFGIIAIITRLSSSTLRSAVVAGVLAVCCFSSLQFVAWTLENARDNNISRANVFMPPLYLPQGDADALRFLKQNRASQSSAVLCLPFIGSYVPRESGRYAFIGHWAETLHFTDKLGEVGKFYGGGMSSSQARAWLKKNRIGFVILASYEKQLQARLPLELPRIYEQNGTAIYAVPF